MSVEDGMKLAGVGTFIFQQRQLLAARAQNYCEQKGLHDPERQSWTDLGTTDDGKGRVLNRHIGRTLGSACGGRCLTRKRADLLSAEKKRIDRPSTGSDHCESSSEGRQHKGWPELATT